MKNFCLLLVILCAFLVSFAISQPSITFNVTGIEAAPFGPWMFSTDVCGTFSPFCGGQGVYAYRIIRWNPTGTGTNKTPDGTCCSGATGSGVATSTSCIGEATSVLSSTSGVTIYFDSFSMTGFQRTGSSGTMGDRRVYSGAQGSIKVDNVDKLIFTNSRITFDVPYPGTCGAGGGITGNGWATIDKINSDAAWVAEFDPNGTGQVEIATTSFSPVVQQCYGTYSGTMTIQTCANKENIVSGTLSSTGGSIDVTVDLSSADASLHFTSATLGKDESGNPSASLNTVVTNQILNAPSGSLPGGITAMSQIYWQMLTTLDSFTTDVTFDLARVAGVNNTANLRILKRENSSAAWSVVSSYTLVDATHIRADGVTSLSEWSIGSTADNPLPVTLQEFDAVRTDGDVVVKWKMASDNNSHGFEVERKQLYTNQVHVRTQSAESSPAKWTMLTFVPAKLSDAASPQYSYVDKPGPGIYLYRLKQIDKDGKFTYSSESEVRIELQPTDYVLKQNFPNPFNPTTTIQFALKTDAKTTLKVYNTLGQEIALLYNGIAYAGVMYSIVWDGRGMPSDTYFCVLESEMRKETIKLSLVK